MRNPIITILSVAFLYLIGATAGCIAANNKQVIDTKDVPGTYVGQYAGGNDTFVLKPDHSYTQQFQIHQKIVLTARGQWMLTGDTISFSPMFYAFTNGEEGKFERVDRCDGYLVNNAIVFSEDENYALSKKTNH